MQPPPRRVVPPDDLPRQTPAVKLRRSPAAGLGLALALTGALPAAEIPPPTAPLVPGGLRCEGTVDPVGIDEPRPELSWVLASDRRGARQTAWQVRVASNPRSLADNSPDLWDSGRVAADETAHIPYAGKPLPSSAPAWWAVRVWDENAQASAWSTNASWTMGITTPSDWHARWVTFGGTNGLPLLRREFTLTQPVRRAVLHYVALGHGEVALDGRTVGTRFLDPAWSVYERTVYATTCDLTAALQTTGPHCLGVMLGKGFYRTAGDRRVHGVQSDRPLRLLLQLELTYADGRRETVLSDDAWRATGGPITHSAILGGEDYDARRWPAGWNLPGFDASAWGPVAFTNGPGGVVRGAVAPPMARLQEFPAVRMEEPEPGKFVYDFGQNAAAVPRLRIRGRAGQVVRLTPAEQRFGMSPRSNDGHGLVNPAGVGRPCHFEYTLRGGAEEAWSPQFTYAGFQYLQLEGGVPAGRPNPQGLPEVLELASVRVGSTVRETGEFECSNPLLNAIDRNIAWAVRANLSHVLTDCPHREKLGWLEVSYLMGPSILGRFDAARFYAKIASDCADSQSPDGRVPTVAPAYPSFSGGFAFTPEWGAAAVVNPWLGYEWNADRRTLERGFPMMRGFVDHLRARSKHLVPEPGLGDWYDYGHGKPAGESQFTPPELSAMATFHRCTRIVADAARVLGRADDARRYDALAADIARAFEARWFRPPDQYLNRGSPQTANSMSLVTGLTPTERAPGVLGAVVADLRTRGNQQTAGDIGYWYLIQALARNHRSDVLFDLVTRTNLGSYGFIVQHGWTAMPEAWDADTGASMNHCMLGHIQEWFLGWVAGIRPDPDPGPASAGFRRFVISPQPVADLTWARGRLDTLRGPVAAEWHRDPTGLTLEVTVPPNTTARVTIPAARNTPVTDEHGPAAGSRDDHGVTVEVPGGRYRWQARPSP